MRFDFTSTTQKREHQFASQGDSHGLIVSLWQCVAPAIKIKQLQPAAAPKEENERVSGRFIWYIWQRPNGIPMEQPTKSYVGGGGAAQRIGAEADCCRMFSTPHSINYIYERASGERTFGGKLSENYKYKHNTLTSKRLMAFSQSEERGKQRADADGRWK